MLRKNQICYVVTTKDGDITNFKSGVIITQCKYNYCISKKRFYSVDVLSQGQEYNQTVLREKDTIVLADYLFKKRIDAEIFRDHIIKYIVPYCK